MENKRFIPLSVPNIKGNELKYITEAIESEWVSTAGGYITSFENKFANYLNIENACACQSGTAGLHLCLRVLNIHDGDIILVPTLTFIATINALMYEKVQPVFFDCDSHLCIDVMQIKYYLENNCEYDGTTVIDKATRNYVKAVMPVHVFGDTTNMEALMELCEKYGLFVIEDATESLGSRFIEGKYSEQYTGTIGHLGVFSFNGNKIITTGGGGMVVSKDKELIDRIRYLSTQAKDDTVYFVHNEVGYNYRMTNLQAALGLGQLEQLDTFIKTKRNNYFEYKKRLSVCSWGEMLDFNSDIEANYWFYSFRIKDGDYKTRDGLIKHLNDNNIQVRPIWKLNHTQKPFLHFSSMTCHNAENFYNSVVNLPCSSNLTIEEIDIVCNMILNYNLDNIGE